MGSSSSASARSWTSLRHAHRERRPFDFTAFKRKGAAAPFVYGASPRLYRTRLRLRHLVRRSAELLGHRRGRGLLLHRRRLLLHRRRLLHRRGLLLLSNGLLRRGLLR